jgi:hypothetical protein
VFLLPDGTPNPAGRRVLAYLGEFCRANKPTAMFDHGGRMDALSSARMDGRREVFLLLTEYLYLTDQTLLALEKEQDHVSND